MEIFKFLGILSCLSFLLFLRTELQHRLLFISINHLFTTIFIGYCFAINVYTHKQNKLNK